MLSHAEEVATKCELLDHVWGDYDLDHRNVVEVHVSSLRRKIAGASAESPIETVWGVGYKLTAR